MSEPVKFVLFVCRNRHQRTVPGHCQQCRKDAYWQTKADPERYTAYRAKKRTEYRVRVRKPGQKAKIKKWNHDAHQRELKASPEAVIKQKEKLEMLAKVYPKKSIKQRQLEATQRLLAEADARAKKHRERQNKIEQAQAQQVRMGVHRVAYL